MKHFSLYIHIPFCAQKCPYCDFNTYAVMSIPEEPYVEALITELKKYSLTSEFNGRAVSSIYFGGGTPSIFSPESIDRILRAVAETFPILEPLEITLEANPGMLTEERIEGFSFVGINRLSLGAQSFTDRILKLLGRRHESSDIEQAIFRGRQAGIKNISIDLIFGVPEQTHYELEYDIGRVLGSQIDHVSLYGLTIEEGTPFYKDFHNGYFSLPKEEALEEFMRSIHVNLASGGFKRYEISNYARQGFESKHNKNYWDGGSYLGIGAGAHSFCENDKFNFGIRWSNRAKPSEYIEEIQRNGSAKAWTEVLDEKKARSEFFMLGLRRAEGVAFAEYHARFQRDLKTDYSAILLVLTEAGLLLQDRERIALTEKGVFLADSVVEEFFPL